MSSVDNNRPPSVADQPALAERVSPDNRLGWQRALEAEGLKHALDGTRIFPGSRFVAATDAESPALKAGLSKVIARTDNDASMRAESFDEKSAPEASYAARQQSMNENSRSEAPRALPIHGLGLEPKSTNESSGLLTKPAGRIDPSYFSNSQLWAQRKVSFLKTGDNEVALYIRDLSLNAGKTMAMLADVRRSIAETGNKLVKLTLNGKEIYPESPERIAQVNQGKE